MKYKSNFIEFEDTPKNQNESDRYANLLAQGNYPAGLDGCFTVGISGGCGLSCFVYKNGECKEPDEMINNRKNEMTDKDLEKFCDLYPNSNYAKKRLGQATLNTPQQSRNVSNKC